MADHDPKCHLLTYGAGPGVCDCGLQARLAQAAHDRCKHHWTVTSECPKCLREEVDRLRAQVARLQDDAMMACEQPPPDCGCSGCSYAREVGGAQ